ncbi:VIT family-domain-containing protein [Kockovaella imperatae]|uniref:VIT family-domain-containing protein n=1 Tax=Kockovaella imperatae TaxID=4999 RepID=A0A1Y1UNI0_9TREE|nr:VIT family-domain-containing protein [Kockovaella imperatae]ORX39611.1 VIT family-domain-containing protein [Kockovaella imperatae]
MTLPSSSNSINNTNNSQNLSSSAQQPIALSRSPRGESSPSTFTPVWSVDPPPPRPPPESAPPLGARTSVHNLQAQLDHLTKGDEPLSEKCQVQQMHRETCCKELKGEDERHLIAPAVVRDIIVGLSDGLTVPFALTAGLSSIGSSRLVVTAGLAELCAGAISMGLGGFLASQAELDHYKYLQRQTHARVVRSCAAQMEREVHELLGPYGIKEVTSRLIVDQLAGLEGGGREHRSPKNSMGIEGVYTPAPPLPLAPSPPPRRNISRFNFQALFRSNDTAETGSIGPSEDIGLTPFLVKFGEGMEAVSISRLWISALTIGMSYFIGGLVPLIPYMAHADTRNGLIISASVTGLVLFIFGAFKTYFTGAKGGFGGYLYGATSTLIVGAIGAGAAYGLVRAMNVKEA